MKILNNSKSSMTKYLGVRVPPDIFNYIIIFTVAKGISKTSLLKTQLNKWMKFQKKKESYENLLCELSKRITRKWLIEKRKNPATNSLNFKKSIQLELISKGLSNDYINIVLTNIKIE
jgi:hypothetical protein